VRAALVHLCAAAGGGAGMGGGACGGKG
jgi:hypothetical protein